jgi:hypothetical protein
MNNNMAELICGGIKCDNPSCDFVDMDVSIEDYKDWLNKPCPKCGSNLLTESDYNTVQMLCEIVNAVNEHPMPNMEEQDEKMVAMTFHMDGTGKMDIEINDVE